MTQELRKLAEEADSAMTYEREWTEFKKACTPAAILELLERVEKADALVKAIKTDRHDWEDWPDDSREAFRAMEASK